MSVSNLNVEEQLEKNMYETDCFKSYRGFLPNATFGSGKNLH
jgi:hypothetical protein